MMTRMKPNVFWDLLKSELDKWWKIDAEKKNSAFNDNTQRTCQMILFLVEFGRKNNYYVETEAFPHIDVGYYSTSAPEWGNWSFEVAIEHENKPFPDWQKECSKLMGVTAGLKVLITYYSEKKDELRKEIEEFSGIYESRLYHQADDKYLFIFIPSSQFTETENYSVYEFTNDKLTEIQ